MAFSLDLVPATNDTTPSNRLWLRSELMGTQVITRDTGRRLGVVGELVVDIDRREVVGLGLRDSVLTRFLPGLPRWMGLDQIRQVGDVVLVDAVDCLDESFNPDRYSRVINCQVITESGEQLGRVLGFSFDIETGELISLVIGALGVPLLGEGVLSTWELGVMEIVSSGPDRIIVYEGAEEKLKQLSTGLLEKLGITGNAWDRDDQGSYAATMVPVENQLAPGLPSEQDQRRINAARAGVALPQRQDVPEMDYVELDDMAATNREQRRLYLDEEVPPSRASRPNRPANPYWEEDEAHPEPSPPRSHGSPPTVPIDDQEEDPWADPPAAPPG